LNNICVICNDETTFLNRRKIANNEVVCESCFSKAKTLTPKQILKYKSLTSDEIRQSIIDSGEGGIEIADFNPTKVIDSFVAFDDEKELIAISPKLRARIYEYSHIIDFELLEDGETITSGGLGRALAGGLLFGGTGAIVGGITGKRKNKESINRLSIKINFNNIEKPNDYINFIYKKTKKDSIEYKDAYNKAQECLSILQIICDKNSHSDNSKTTASAADEIMKYKNLLDAGAITEEEYNAKKKELLGL
jgi:hypothetical protein